MADPTGAGGNISAAPQFVDPLTLSFELQPHSPCVDAGDPRFRDLDGSRADMGSHGGLGGTP
jgi:hypothetical protein